MLEKNTEILRMEGITKVYPNGFVANSKVNFSLYAREVHALMGENGAGKSTLMKILFGLEQPQEGRILLHGEPLKIPSPKVAMQHGICMVHQHFMLVPSFSVAENLILGAEPLKRGMLDLKRAIQITEEIGKKYNLYIDPKAKIEDLSVAKKQKVEILKALLRGAKILILDEPTAVLTPQETEELFVQLRILKDKGHTVIFISHKLDEIKQVCDRITVLRDGKFIATVLQGTVSKEEISRLMVGREVSLKIQKPKPRPSSVCLRVQGLSYAKHNKTVLDNINFTVRSGEILGIAGVEGNGQEELVNLITGMSPLEQGQIKIGEAVIDGARKNARKDTGAEASKWAASLSVRQIRELGLSHIHADRIKYGVAVGAALQDNLFSDRYYKSKYNRYLLLKFQLIAEESRNLVTEYGIKCSSIRQGLKNLSGGNMQKVVIAREISTAPRLLVANQPTRGVDVGSAESIYRHIISIRDAGTAVLLLSSDLAEVMQLSDRLIVLHSGQIAAHFADLADCPDSEIGQYMLGLKQQDQDGIQQAVAL